MQNIAKILLIIFCTTHISSVMAADNSPHSSAKMTAYRAFDQGLYKTAIKLATQEAKTGSEDAAYLLGQIYRKGLGGVKVDVKLALTWYRKASKLGHIEATFIYGYALAQGQSIDKDIIGAKAYFLKAAKADHTLAQYNLAQIYAGLAGQAADYTKAFKWFKKAADNDHAQSQIDLAILYIEGKGVVENQTLAARYMLKAARNERKDAMVRYAIMAFNGLGIEANIPEAVYWFKNAATLGQPSAQTRLARLYLKGVGVEQNTEVAVMLYRLAQHAKAEDSWLDLEFKKLPQTTLDKGQIMADKWLKNTAKTSGKP